MANRTQQSTLRHPPERIIASLRKRIEKASSGDQYTRDELERVVLAWALSVFQLSEGDEQDLLKASGHVLEERLDGGIAVIKKEAANG